MQNSEITYTKSAGDTVWKYKLFVKSVNTGVLFDTKLMRTGVGRGSPARGQFALGTSSA